MRVKRLLVLVPLLLAVVLFLPACSVKQGGPPAPTMMEYRPPVPLSWRLPNGLTVYYLEDFELPLIEGTLYLPGGAWWDGADEVGFSHAMGAMLRQGGAGGLSADALDRRLEELAAGIGSSFGDEFGTVSFQALVGDAAEIFSLFSDVVRRPRFEKWRLTVWQGQRLEAIERRRQNPDDIASLAFQELIFGDSPYGQVVAAENVKAVQSRHLRELHRRWVRPDEAILAFTGALPAAAAQKLVERSFGDWQAAGQRRPPLPVLTQQPEPGVYFIRAPFEQTTFIMGELGPPRLSPDYPEIAVFNEIFGAGGFGARLTQRIRVELGYAYRTYGAILPEAHRGRNMIFVQTKTESLLPAVLESLRVLQGLQGAQVPEAELGRAQTSIKNSFIFRFDTEQKLVNRQALLQLLEFPADYDRTYLPKVDQVSPESLLVSAREHWDQSRFVLVVVGNQRAYNELQQLAAADDEVLLKFAGGRWEPKELVFDQKLRK